MVTTGLLALSRYTVTYDAYTILFCYSLSVCSARYLISTTSRLKLSTGGQSGCATYISDFSHLSLVFTVGICVFRLKL